MSDVAVIEAPAPLERVVRDLKRVAVGKTRAVVEPRAVESRPRESAGESRRSPVERVCQLGAVGRLAAYERGQLSWHELAIWAGRFPEEVPLVNGEVPWIALTLADLD